MFKARGPKKHLKRVAAPKHWMLDKLTGVFVSFLVSPSHTHILLYRTILMCVWLNVAGNVNWL